MAYPPGLLLRTVQLGPILDSSGKPARGSGFVSADTSIHYDPSDVDILNDPFPVKFDATGSIIFQWPLSDQPFMSDGRGNPLVDFTSTLSFEFTDSSLPSLPDITFLTPDGVGTLVLITDLSVTRTAGIVTEPPSEGTAIRAEQAALEAAASAASVNKGAPNGVAPLDGSAIIPIAHIPGIVRTTDGSKPLGKSVMVEALAYGPMGTAAQTDATLAAAINACAALGGGVVRLPPSLPSTGIPFNQISLLKGQHEGVVIEGAGGATSRYLGVPGFPTRPRGTTTLICQATGSAPAVVWEAPGSGLRYLNINGNGRTATIVDHWAFESICSGVRILNADGIGLDVRRGNNSWWSNVIVSDCGKPGVYAESNPGVSGFDTIVTPALPQVKIWTDASLIPPPGDFTYITSSTNTFTIWDLSQENCRGDVSIEIGNKTGTSWAQSTRLPNLHIENFHANVAAPTATAGLEPTIRLYNIDGLVVEGGMIYGGGPKSYIIEHDQANAAVYFGDAQFIGGWLLGSDPALGGATPTLVHAKKGNGLSFTDTEFCRFSGSAVRIEGAYGAGFYTNAKSSFSERKSGVSRVDFRTTPSLYVTPGDSRLEGQVISRGVAPTIFIGAGGDTASVLASSTDMRGRIKITTDATVAANVDIAGVVFARPFGFAPVVTLTPTREAAITPPVPFPYYVVSTTTGFIVYTSAAISSAVVDCVFGWIAIG